MTNPPPARSVLAGLVLLALGCSSPTGPNRFTLNGTWGGDNLQVVASAEAVQVHRRCLHFSASAVPDLGPGDTVRVAGKITGGWSGALGGDMEMEISLEGDELHLHSRLRYPGGEWFGWADEDLIRDQEPAWSGACIQ
jgi:hypothetical protein